MSSQPAPGILRLLPETLPFYPYRENLDTGRHRTNLHRRKQHYPDEEDNAVDVDPNAPLHRSSSGFTLFFFVDSTNRQSLIAIPLVSQWFHHTLSESTVICTPNHPVQRQISLRDATSDPIIQSSINSSITPAAKQHVSMLSNTGFYHLPFLHPKRLPLLHLLGATRVPCVIVVSNDTGRIVTRYGWEAIEREVRSKDKKDGDVGNEIGSNSCFQSHIVNEWMKGNSGLPFWWHLLSWILI